MAAIGCRSEAAATNLASPAPKTLKRESWPSASIRTRAAARLVPTASTSSCRNRVATPATATTPTVSSGMMRRLMSLTTATAMAAKAVPRSPMVKSDAVVMALPEAGSASGRMARLPTNAAEPALRASQLVGDGVEVVGQLLADQRHRADDGDGDQGGDQAIFDGRDAFFARDRKLGGDIVGKYANVAHVDSFGSVRCWRHQECEQRPKHRHWVLGIKAPFDGA